MTRSGFNKLWLLAILGMAAIAFYIYTKGEALRSQVARADRKIEQLRLKLQEGNQLSAVLADLDNFTINERDTTKLDILRYLQLEESDLNFKNKSKTVRRISGTNLYVRTFELTGELPYAEAMSQMDWLHNTKKTSISNIVITQANEYFDVVNLKVEGILYGVDKSK